MKNELLKYNECFVLNDFEGQIEKKSVFSYIEKSSKVCLCAPHSVKSFANKSIKKSDLYTGALVSFIGEKFGFSYIVRNKFVDYKCRIDDFVLENKLGNHYFLDIHGMKNNDEFDLAVGLGCGNVEDYNDELAKIDELALKFGIRYVINHPCYMGKVGFTGKFQQKSGKTNIMQLEWSKDFRDFNKKFEIVEAKTIPFLVDFAMYINELIK